MIIGECKDGPIPAKRITTIKALLRVCKYLEDGDHDRHKNVSVGQLNFWHGSKKNIHNSFHSIQEFAELVEAMNLKYQSSRNSKGTHPLAKHLFVAPAVGEVVGKEEEEITAKTVLSIVATDSPALYTWHRSEKRVELHIVVASTNSQNRNRETDLRKRYRIDGVRGIHNFAKTRASNLIQLIRGGYSQKNRKTWSKKKLAKSEPILLYIKYHAHDQMEKFETRSTILKHLSEHRIHITKITKKNISIKEPFRNVIHRIPWDALFSLYSEIESDRELERKERAKKDRLEQIIMNELYTGIPGIFPDSQVRDLDSLEKDEPGPEPESDSFNEI